MLSDIEHDKLRQVMVKNPNDYLREINTTFGFLLHFQMADEVKDMVVRNLPDNLPIADLPSPSGDLIIFVADTGPVRITLAARPSGTEPKIKFYGFALEMTPQPNGHPGTTAGDVLDSVATGLADFLERQLSLPTDRKTSADE